MVVGLVTSKYVRAMSLQMEALTFSKTFCRELFHSNGTSFLVRALRGAVSCVDVLQNVAPHGSRNQHSLSFQYLFFFFFESQSILYY